MRAALASRHLRTSCYKPSTANSTGATANNECADELIARQLDELATMARAAANARAVSMGLDKRTFADMCARRASCAAPGNAHVSHGSNPPRLLHLPPVHDNDKDRAATQSSAMDRRCGVCTNDLNEYDSEDNYSQSSFEDDDC